jgi:SAM-dependent methyltransferase
MPTLDWEDYLKPPNISAAEHKATSAATFASQRENISKLCRILRPHSVACMGAGYLNDIPLETLVANNADIYLVERVDGITERSFQHDLVMQIEQRFVCLICQCFHDPKKYCQNHGNGSGRLAFFSRAPKRADHCENFVRAEAKTAPLCGNYAPAAFPRFLRADVTRGVAEHFARQVAVILRHAKKPQQALREAIHISARPRADALLPLADHSVDFVTSSMVASQFDFEPYTYFIRNLYLRFGQEAVERNTNALNALAETLRNNLFLTQVEAHCQEIARLLKPNGRVYFSIEALHKEQPSDHWFYAEITNKAMEIVARHFLFDLETLPEIIVPTRTEMVRGGTSIIHSYLLLLKHPSEKRPSPAAFL